MTDFTTYLKTVPAEINNRLNDYLAAWSKTANTYSPLIEPLYAQFADSCADGKRLRGSLIKLGYDMAGGSMDHDGIYNAMLGFEIFQVGILAHDDIIDNSPLRRGKPTLFKALESRCAEHLAPRHNATHYGISQTICLGDMGLFMAVQMINDSPFGDATKNKAVSFFTRAVIDTIAGQMLDVELPYLPDSGIITVNDLMTVGLYKSARYTITGPLSLGLILANGSHGTLDGAQTYGDNLGIAFQLKDDILGIFGDEAVTGKSATSDIEEGKITLLYHTAWDRATPAQRTFLKAHYGAGPITASVHNDIKTILTDTGARDHTETTMHDLAAKANDAIPLVTARESYQSTLRDLADFMINRSK